MDFETKRLVDEVLRLAAGKPDTDQLRVKAIAAKQALLEEFYDLQRAVNSIDGVVQYRAPGIDWQPGWIQPTATGRPYAKSDRPRRAVEIARQLVLDGATTVTTRQVAERLSAEGDTAPKKDLMTAVGNVLARTSGWQRIGDGEYAPADSEGA